MEQINSYLKGIDLDTSYNKISNEHYLHLEGGIVITREGASSGAIQTEKGLKHIFNFPDVPKVYKFSVTSIIEDNFFNFQLAGITDLITIDLLGVSNTKELYLLIINNPLISPHLNTVSVNYSNDFNNITIYANSNPLSDLLTVFFSNSNNIEYKLIPSQTNVVALKAVNYRNILYILTLSLDNPESNGQIFKVDIDPITMQVNTSFGLLPFGQPLPIADTLIYSETLNFSREYYVTKLIASPESQSVFRLYWNDRLNPIRSFNTLVDFPINYPLSLLENSGKVLLPEIKVVDIVDGGFIPVGSKVQYYYRLRSSQSGSSTVISSGSQLIKLGRGNSKDDNSDTLYKGAELDAAVNDPNESLYKSIEVSIEGIDTIYQFLELIYVVYELENVANAYIVAEIPISSNGSVRYLHDGNSINFANFPLQGINESVFNVSKANDIEIKDNRMIAVGVTVSNAALDFDCRAYRFNNLGITKLLSNQEDDIEIDSNLFTESELLEELSNIPETHDCINPYNNEALVQDWMNNQQYKFHPNGFTMGGFGPNISYTFTNYQLQVSENITENRVVPPFIKSGRFSDGEIIDLGKSRQYDVSREFRDFRSPIVDSVLKGYAREEVYRIGFQAFDLKGNPYYVNWIGDIKMPAEWDGNTIDVINGTSLDNYRIGDTLGDNTAVVYSLGLKFTIKNLDKIRDKVSSYCFVKVKRDENNKSKLAHGIINPMTVTDYLDSNITYSDSFENTSRFHLNGPYNEVLPNFDVYSTAEEPAVANLYSFKSIDDYIFDRTFKYNSGDYVVPTTLYNSFQRYTVDSQGRIYLVRTEAREYVNKLSPFGRLNLVDSKWKEVDMSLRVNQLNTYTTAPNLQVIQNNDLRWLRLPPSYSASKLERNYQHIRNRILAVDSNAPRINYNTDTPFPFSNNNATVDPLVVFGSYKRKLQNQYGGNEYFQRQTNVYHPISPRIILDTTNETTDIVFGGDVCLSYFGFRIFWANKADDVGVEFTRPNYVQYGFTESEVNPYYDHNLNWFRDEYTPSQADTLVQGLGYVANNYFTYNKVYLQQNILKVFAPRPTFVTDIDEFPDGIFVSDPKLPGDRIDSWLVYRLDNYKRVEGIYGSINALVLYRDKLFYLQDRAIGVQAINEQAITFNDETGNKIVLGDGELVGDHGYISTKTGTVHQSSVLATEYNLYYYDALLNKIRILNSESSMPLSDALSISSFMQNNFANTNLVNNDKHLIGTGVHTSIDLINKRVYFTFLEASSGIKKSLCYNENTKGIEFFPLVHPNLYLDGYKFIMSDNPNNPNQVYLHNFGDFNTYYDGEKLPLKLKFVVNNPPQLEKVFTNLIWKSEAYDINGSYLPNIGITSIRVYNNFQDTGYQTNIKKVLRQFSHKIQFNQLSTRKIDRIRNSWTIVEMTFDNPNNVRLVLHDVITKFQPSYSGLEQI